MPVPNPVPPPKTSGVSAVHDEMPPPARLIELALAPADTPVATATTTKSPVWILAPSVRAWLVTAVNPLVAEVALAARYVIGGALDEVRARGRWSGGPGRENGPRKGGSLRRGAGIRYPPVS
jgi:hypothetical protein